MRIVYISLMLCVALLGAGCAKGSDGQKQQLPSAQSAQRVLPAPPAEPSAAPEIPDAAKNIPRPTQE